MGRCGTFANRLPHFGLVLVDGGLFPDARMHHGLCSTELRTGRPAPMLDAEHVERQWIGAGSNDAVFGDNTVLLAAADELTCKKKDRAVAAINQNKLIHGRAGIVLRRGGWSHIAAARHALGALFTNDHIAR